MEIVWFIAVGLAIGSTADQLMKRGSLGRVGDILFGVVGALFAGYLFHMLGLFAEAGYIGSLIVAALGALALLAVLRAVNPA